MVFEPQADYWRSEALSVRGSGARVLWRLRSLIRAATEAMTRERSAMGGNVSGMRWNVSRSILTVVALLLLASFLMAQRSVWVSSSISGQVQLLSTAMKFEPRVTGRKEIVPATMVSKVATEGSDNSSHTTTENNTKSSENGNERANTLTKEEVDKIAPDGILLVTMANYHFLDFVVTWVDHLRKIDVTSYIVGTLDNKLHGVLKEMNINSFDLESGLPVSDFGWGSKTFFRMGLMKVREILLFMEMGVNIIFTDIDAIWMRNPIPYWREHWRADLLVSSDMVAPTHVDGGLEDPTIVHSANIGILMMKPSLRNMTRQWLEMLVADEKYWDQQALNDLLNPDRSSSLTDPDRLFKDVNGTLLMGYLPISLFCSGHTFFVQNMHRKHNLHPFTVHATFQYSGTQGKRHRFREALLWNDPPEYFDAPNGFLAYVPDLPEDLLANASPKFPDKIWLNDTSGHFALVNHQLIQIRKALSVAYTLNRTLIFPEVWCGHERYWNPHPGALPGAKTELPYLCPLDHVLDLGKMLPADKQPFIDIREYSFLRNKRLPDSVRRSTLRVTICNKKNTTCKDGDDWDDFTIDGNPHTQFAQIKANLTDVQLKEALGDHSTYKILYFSSMMDAFSGFENATTANFFENSTKEFPSIWCCVQGERPGAPGHIYYDLYHDVIPHTDRFGRKFNKTWFPIRGP